MGNSEEAQTSQMDEMLGILDGAGGNGEAGSPEDEAPVDEPENENEEPEEPSSEEEESSSEPTREELMEEVQQLRNEVEKQDQPEEEQEEPAEEPNAFNVEGLDDLISEEEYDKALSGPEGLNEVFKNVFERFYQKAAPKLIEQSARTASRTKTQEDIVKSFRQENQDLTGQMGYVGYKANKIRSENPNMGLREVLNKAAESVRQEIGKTSTGSGSSPSSSSDAAFTPDQTGGSSSRGQQEPSSQDSGDSQKDQIDEMLEAI